MMPSLSLAAAAVAAAAAVMAGSAVAQSLNTATSTAAVYAAQATAKTDSPVSDVAGAAFDRIAIIWLENTDYAKAVGDPNLAALAAKGVTLSNYFGVTHPSEPNYVAAIGGDYFGMDNDKCVALRFPLALSFCLHPSSTGPHSSACFSKHAQ